MAFDPNLPANNSPLSSQVIRNQFNALKELIPTNVGNGPKIYRALLSQAGENHPTAVVLENTLGTEITWQREGVGLYRGQPNAGAFASEKTFHRIHSAAIVDYASGTASSRIESGGIYIETVVSGAPADYQLIATPVEILIYP